MSQKKLNFLAASILKDQVVEMGIAPEGVESTNEGNDYKLKVLGLPESVEIIITVSDFWKHPGKACYFVSYNKTNGDFMACAGTDKRNMAIFNLGQAYSMIPSKASS